MVVNISKVLFVFIAPEIWRLVYTRVSGLNLVSRVVRCSEKQALRTRPNNAEVIT